MKSIIFLLMIVGMISCDHSFDLKEVDSQEKLVLYCFPSNQDTTIIQLSRSIPVGHKERLEKGVSDTSAIFMVNGEEQHIYWNETSTSTLPAQCYYIVKALGANDQIQFQAKVKNLPEIYAHTVIPTAFPLNTIKLIVKNRSNNILQVQIAFDDDIKTKDYYGVRIVKKETTKLDGKEEILYRNAELDLKNEPLLNDLSDLDQLFMFGNQYFRNLYIWSDDNIQGKNYTLHLNMDYQKNFSVDWNNYSYKVEYKICLYKFSPEFYFYLKAINSISNNNLSNHGFSPILYHYTNVVNGIGVLGGCQITETEWLKNVN